jgi:hypothetical protein
VTLVSLDAEHLLTMSRSQLDDLFRASPPGDIPRGAGEGTVLAAPGTAVAAPVARLAHLLAWQGKVVDPDKGELRNRVSPLGLLAIRARVYVGTSLFDGEDTIVLDYSKTSLVARFVRDEIRLVGPSLYLGVVYWDGARILNFALQFAR